MEDQKSKPGGIALDYNKLLLNDDDPLSIEVIKRKAEMGGGDEDTSFATFSLQELLDKQLSMNMTLKRTGRLLDDGGKKLRATLESIGRELERRKKFEGNCNIKKALPLASKSTCIGEGTAFGLSNGASTAVAVTRSDFRSCFSGKLDDKSAHGRTKAFGEELSTLNRCNQKNTSSYMKMQKTGSSSRQSPFASPSSLSSSIDKRRQSDRHSDRQSDKRSRSQFSIPSPRQSDIYSTDIFVRNIGTRFQQSRSSKQNPETVILSEEEEPEDDATDQVEEEDPSLKETRIYYPSSDDPESIEINYADLKCLAPDTYLSSNIMNFYIRYVQKPTSPTAGKRCDYHFFTTYFYKKLKQHVSNMSVKETSFVKLRKWWKGVNIFEKAYIFLPVHESQHWSLVIICIPDKDDESGLIMLHLDSLGLHSSSSIFKDVKSVLIEEWNFLNEGEDILEIPISDKVWDSLSHKIHEKAIEVPQQRNDYDCGLFVLYFLERFIEDAPERLKKDDLEMFGTQWFRPQEASNLRRKIRDLLREEFKNANKIVHNLDP